MKNIVLILLIIITTESFSQQTKLDVKLTKKDGQ